MNNPSEVYVVHVPSARNVGDALSNPLKHFRMQHKVLSIGKPDLVYQIPSGSTVIFGGGGLIGEKPAWDAVLNNIANRTDIKKVLWGAGFNRSLRGGSNLEQIPLQHKELFSKFDLLGIRDVIEGLDWVPCASCMSEAFDLYPNSRSRRISIYLHGDRIKGLQKNIQDMTESNPTMNNFTGEKSFNEIIKFISDSEFLFTNSFHGMYWAFLTGTTPIIFDIFSEKFLLARWKAEMLLPDQDPELVMMNARQFSNALHDSRTANLQFYQRFKHLISLPHLR